MKDEDKTKEQILNELRELRQRIAEFEKLETERKKTEEALRESEEMYKKLLKTSPDYAGVSDLEGNLIEVSQSVIDYLGLENADEIIGKNGFLRIAPEDHEKVKKAMQKILKEGYARNLELTWVRKDGTRFIGESNAALIKDSNGRPKAFLHTTRDITERKKMEEELKQYSEKLEQMVEERTRELIAAQKEVKTLQKQIQQSQKYPEIVGNSPKIIQVIDLVHQVARTNSTILIYGETGSGKDLIAQAIHHNSSRREAPFVIVNCSALPEHLIESELFGYVKGAFTGAIKDKKGFFEEANKGTIFLNEIADVPLRLQGKLLHVLENQQIHRLGQSKNIKVDIRIIAASNIDLDKAVSNGFFRQDLFYRLNVFPIVIPPLRERKEDIPILVKHFLDKYCPAMGKQINHISREAMDILSQYNYPGNVRELENIIQRSIIMAQGYSLLPNHLPKELKGVKTSSEPETIPDMEKQMIEAALKQCQGHFSRTAQKLGIHRTTLWRKIKKLDIKLPPFDA